jgi:hypothetical protein
MSSYIKLGILTTLGLAVLIFSLYVNWLMLDLHTTTEQANSSGGKFITVMALVGCLAAFGSTEKDFNHFRSLSMIQWFLAYVWTVCLILPEAANYGLHHPGAGQGADFVLYGALFGGVLFSAPGAMISFLGTCLLSCSFTMYKKLTPA